MRLASGRTVGGVDVCLRNGTRVLIRPIKADDKALLVRGMASLSPQSARLRFLAPKNHLSLAELRYLTEVDHVDHYALVAVLADDPSTMAAVGRWVRDREHPDAAELAIVVGDCYQGQGLGTALGIALADGARSLGIGRFNATMLAENIAAQRLFAHISGRLSTRVEGGNYELVADLAA
jgi:RimJ/RimL family protein N-acetyltransferase